MKILKNWELFTENNYDNIPEYVLKVETQFVGTEELIEMDVDFTYQDYVKYKNNEMPQFLYEQFENQAIEHFGLEWEIDGDELVITTQYIGDEERVYDEDLEEYDEDELRNMAIDGMELGWEIVENKEHPDYEKRKKTREFNL